MKITKKERNNLPRMDFSGINSMKINDIIAIAEESGTLNKDTGEFIRGLMLLEVKRLSIKFMDMRRTHKICTVYPNRKYCIND